MMYLRLPISIDSCGEPLSAEVYLPSRMRGLTICVSRNDHQASRQRMCEMLSDIGMATLLLQSPSDLSSKHIIAAVDWVRAKRLLRRLPINIVTTGKDDRAAQKAAQRRPVAVRNVLSTACVAQRLAFAV